MLYSFINFQWRYGGINHLSLLRLDPPYIPLRKMKWMVIYFLHMPEYTDPLLSTNHSPRLYLSLQDRFFFWASSHLWQPHCFYILGYVILNLYWPWFYILYKVNTKIKVSFLSYSFIFRLGWSSNSFFSLTVPWHP